MRKGGMMRAGILLLFFLAGCGPGEHSLGSAATNTPFAQLDSFAALSANIFAKRCTSCHSGANPDGGVDLTSYEKIIGKKDLVSAGNPAASAIYTEVKSGDMPDGGGPRLSAGEVQAIGDWIAAGAPNGAFVPGTTVTPPTPDPSPQPPTPTPTPTPAPVPARPSYRDVQSKLFDAYCVRCHSGPKAKAKVDLSAYPAFKGKANLILPGDAAKSLVYTVIINGKMPPRGATVPSDLQKLLFDWINSGALNN